LKPVTKFLSVFCCLSPQSPATYSDILKSLPSPKEENQKQTKLLQYISLAKGTYSLQKDVTAQMFLLPGSLAQSGT
jgi:hypothetical protein